MLQVPLERGLGYNAGRVSAKAAEWNPSKWNPLGGLCEGPPESVRAAALTSPVSRQRHPSLTGKAGKQQWNCAHTGPVGRLSPSFSSVEPRCNCSMGGLMGQKCGPHKSGHCSLQMKSTELFMGSARFSSGSVSSPHLVCTPL